MYGFSKKISLMLGNDTVIVEKLKGNDGYFITIPDDDLTRDSNESPKDHCPTLEVELCHSLLRDKVQIIMPPDCSSEDFSEVLAKNLDNVLPILIYCFTGCRLSETVSILTILFLYLLMFGFLEYPRNSNY